MKDRLIHWLTRGLFDSMAEDIKTGKPRLWTLFRYKILGRLQNEH